MSVGLEVSAILTEYSKTRFFAHQRSFATTLAKKNEWKYYDDPNIVEFENNSRRTMA